MSGSDATVRRVDTIFDLPDESIRCLALSRHVGFGVDDPTMRPQDGWGRRSAMEVRYACDCGRWRRETVDVDTGEILTRAPDYGGGVLLTNRVTPTRAEARQEYLRRVRSRRGENTVRPIRTASARGRT